MSRVITEADLKAIIENIPTRSIVGEIKMFAGDEQNIPTGWHLCDGSELDKYDYPLLYDAIGDAWGIPSDSGHFVLPNLNGRVPVGANNNDWVTIIRENANATFTLDSDTYCRIGVSDNGGAWSSPALIPKGTYTAAYSALTQFFPTDPASGMTKVIQARLDVGSTGGDSEHVMSTAEMPAHNHTQAGHSHATSPQLYRVENRFGSGSRNAAGTYSGYGAAVNTDSRTPAIYNSGGGLSFSLMQPFAVVNYIICAV